MKTTRLTGTALAAVAALVALLGSARSTAAAFLGMNGKIVFQGFDATAFLTTIAVMDADGSNPKTLATARPARPCR